MPDGPLQNLVRTMGLDQPTFWGPAPEPFVGPQQDVREGWRGWVDTALSIPPSMIKGLTGLGDQGPAGPTVTNAAAVLAAGMPLFGGKLPRFAEALGKYHAPTSEGGLLAAPFYSRLDEAAATLPKSTFGPKVLSLGKGPASTEELALRGVPQFVEGFGNKPVTRDAVQAHLAANPVPTIQVKTLGASTHAAELTAVREQAAASHNHSAIEFANAFPSRAQIAARGEALTSFIAPMDRGEIVDLFQRGQLGDAKAQEALDSWQLGDAQLAALGRYSVRQARTVELLRQAEQLKRADAPPKFSQYQLPGGRDYKETLLTLKPPQLDQAVGEARLKELETHLQGLYQQAEGLNRRGPSNDVNGIWPQIEAAQAEHHTLSRSLSSDPPGMFRSGHFDEPNILVHTRSNTRDLPGLGSGTFLEEVQSDWHQKGKAEGYQGEASAIVKASSEKAATVPITKSGDGRMFITEVDGVRMSDYSEESLRAQISNYFTDIARKGKGSPVPDAPFKESWPDLALKHHLAEAAADPNTHWLGFTSGDTQAARYDLSKQISKLDYNPDTMMLHAYDHSGDQVISKVVGRADLADTIGKEAAKKLLETTRPIASIVEMPATRAHEPYFRVKIGDEFARRGGSIYGASTRAEAEAMLPHFARDTPPHSLAGLDLQVGGEGMHHFYDNLLPKRLDKIVKPYGGTVERLTRGRPLADIVADMDALTKNTPDYGPAFTAKFDALEAEKTRATTPARLEGSWILKLTPELKDRILKYGLPFMAVAGAAALPQEQK